MSYVFGDEEEMLFPWEVKKREERRIRRESERTKCQQCGDDKLLEKLRSTPPPTPPQTKEYRLQVFHTFEIDELNDFLKRIPTTRIVNRHYVPVAINARIHYIIEYKAYDNEL